MGEVEYSLLLAAADAEAAIGAVMAENSMLLLSVPMGWGSMRARFLGLFALGRIKLYESENRNKFKYK